MTEVAARRPPASPLFGAASARAFSELEATARELHLPAREWLFRLGDPAESCFVVVSGRLEVVVEGEEGLRVLRVLGPGAVLGELGLLTRTPRSAAARAVRDSRLLEIDSAHFLELVERDSGFALAVARELARQLQASGGLDLPDARPAVFAIDVLGSIGEPRLVSLLEHALRRWGTVTVLDGGRLEPERFAEALDDAESHHDFVLLVAGLEPEWDEFCRRQCDRLLVCASGEPAAARMEGLEGCELVLVGVAPESVSRWLDAVEPRAHHVVPDGDGFTKGIERVARRLTRRSLGIVLSGGGARGFAHIGVLGALAEAGFEFDRIGGCSMGSFIAALAALGKDAEHIHSTCAQELVRRSPFNDYTLPRVALIRSRKAAVMLERVFDGTLLEELERPLFTVSADLLSSRVVVHRRGRVMDAVGASMSIPGLAPPIRRAGRLLVDGGVLNNLPVDHMAETDEGPVVAVDVIRRLDVLGSVERAEQNRALARLLVTPDVQSIGLREWSALDAAVEMGRRATIEALEAGGEEDLRALLDAPV
jgi:NTE family protein